MDGAAPSSEYKEDIMEKIQMTTPLVEMDGDEMTRILWKIIKEELLLPFIDLKTTITILGWSIGMKPMIR